MRPGKRPGTRPCIEGLERRALLALVPAGVEFQINNTAAGDQFGPAVARDAGGNFVVVWVSDGQDGSGTGIYARRFNASGAPLANEFRVNTITTGAQSLPAVAMDASGDFVVTWASQNVPGGNALDVVARRYNSSGVAQDAAEFRVNTYTTSNQEAPSVSMDANGNFVVAWDSFGQDGSSYGVYARLYSAAGTALGGEIQVAQTTANLQADPSVAMDSSGDFVVAWTSGSLTAPSMYDIYARRFNSAGAAQGNEFQVNTSVTADFQTFASVAIDSDGDFVVAFSSYSAASKYDIYARRYNASGAAQGNEFRVNTFTANNQLGASVSMDSAGNFSVAWTSVGQDGSGRGIYMQSYSNTGASVGGETRVNTNTIDEQHRPAIALDPSGNAVVVWQDGSTTPGVEGQDGSGYGIYAQRYTVVGDTIPPTVSATFNFLTTQSVTFNFSESVSPSFTIADVTVQNLTTSTSIPSGSMTLSYIGTNPATLTFNGFPTTRLANGNYRVTLNAAGITDAAGNQLDGDNNGSAGGNFVFDFFFVNGDANRDRKVDVADLGILASNWQQPGRDFSMGNFDYSANGLVDVADLGILASNWQIGIAAATPAPAPASASRTARPVTRVASEVLT